MRSRWFHAPVLHVPRHDFEKKAGWLELFYDLVFVAAFIQLGNGLSSYVSFNNFLAFAGIFTPLWMAWVGFTYYANRFNVDDILHRVLVLTQMFAVGAMGVTAPQVLQGNPVPFALSFTFAQLLIAVLYYRSFKQEQYARDYSQYWGSVFAVGAVLWFISCFLSAPWCYVLWALGLFSILGSPLHKHSRELMERYPLDLEHLAERFGLLTIIVLGESFVKVILSLSNDGTSLVILGQASFTLMITVCLWWIYFDDVAGSHIKKGKLNPIFWLYGHLPLQIGITATGVAIKKAVFFDLNTPAPDKYRWFLSGTLALVLASTAFIDAVTERRNAELSDKTRVNMRAFSALLILLLAPAGGGMSAFWYLVLITLMCVGQVLFDITTAPFEEDKAATNTETVHEFLKKTSESKEGSTPVIQRRDISEAVRKGTPSELRHDLYFYFMEGSWTRFIASLVFLYVVFNVFFASLYMLSPGSIAEAQPNSFADAFFFSVQTMSTIGYGVMSPESLYGHVLVTIEAAFGLLGVAVITGLMFAKVSRARSSILFSEPVVVSKRHGKRTLQFRVGNSRGNDVVEASMTLSALVDEVTPEGEHLRRVMDLNLVRDRQPFFKLSWSVFHEIDESSPLYNLDLNGGDKLMGLLVTMTGHDGTYGQTIYSRHTYYPENIRENHHFVDVIHQLEDGRLMIDYSQFHQTKPIS